MGCRSSANGCGEPVVAVMRRTKRMGARISELVAGCVALGLAGSVVAEGNPDQGRLLATGGGSQIEGTAGGGIVPLAVLAGYGDAGQSGGNAFASRVQVKDYRLDVFGAAYSWNNRIEISVARQELALDTLADALGVADDSIAQNIFGVKARLFGDLIYGELPQISAGLQYKVNEDFFIPQAAGASDDKDWDAYVVATKLFLGGAFGHNAWLNGVARATRANQGGLVGFGGDANDNHEIVFEGSIGVFLNRQWAAGVEYRQKPDNLSFAREQDWRDVFVAWFPNKQWSVIAAWVDLGDIATLDNQQGWYLSLQGSY